ncbi:MAG: hypothetical protein SH857_08600 [Chitinophagales bacterium]|nr:hypothetical protein [Chitinophagales bacterium]
MKSVVFFSLLLFVLSFNLKGQKQLDINQTIAYINEKLKTLPEEKNDLLLTYWEIKVSDGILTAEQIRQYISPYVDNNKYVTKYSIRVLLLDGLSRKIQAATMPE